MKRGVYGVDFLVPKHLRKSKIGLLEQIWAKNPYVTFFLDHPVYVKENLFWLLMVDQWTANAMVNNNWPLLQKGRERLMRGVSGNTTASICIQSFLFRVFTLLHPFTFPSSSASASLSVFAIYLFSFNSRVPISPASTALATTFESNVFKFDMESFHFIHNPHQHFCNLSILYYFLFTFLLFPYIICISTFAIHLFSS